ncbi:MAG: histidine--tRNA ligase [Verrucomicrobiia bacterium]|jgi:histidyl-tRNA synthetase
MERLPGFRDFYPEPLPDSDSWSAAARRYIFEKWRAIAARYGFVEYDGPPIEPLELYTLKSGDEIVAQLYNFIDKGNRAVALRPELTPTLARMVAAHSRNYKKPLKWFSIPQLFRYERQQKGRLREHFQFNADIIGETGAGAEAELLALAIDILRSFGLGADDFVVRLSSREAWRQFFITNGGKLEDEYQFYQAVDKLERETEENNRQKFSKIGFSLEQIYDFIKKGVPISGLESIINDLKARGLADFVKVDYGVIRGLAYYTGMVFEVFDKKGEFRAIAGGGRYDNLIKLISGGRVDMPALGFGMGDVVLCELLKERKLLPDFKQTIDVYVAIEDESLRPDSLLSVQKLRDGGLSVEYPLSAAKFDKQFKRAIELNARYFIKLQKESSGKIVARLKELHTREEKTDSLEAVINSIIHKVPNPFTGQ